MMEEQTGLIKSVGDLQTDVGKISTELTYLKDGQVSMDGKLERIIGSLNGALDNKIDNRIIIQDARSNKDRRMFFVKLAGVIIATVAVALTIIAMVI